MEHLDRLAGVLALATLVGCIAGPPQEFDDSDPRAVIAAGGVPRPDQIDVNALFAEHPLPAATATCDAPMCAQAAMAVAPNLATHRNEFWVHVATATAPMRRPPVDMVVVIDTSATMSVDLAETTRAIAALIDALRPDDRLAVLAYDDDVQVLHDLGPVVDAAALTARVRALEAGGGWSVQQATARAYEMLGGVPKYMLPPAGPAKPLALLLVGWGSTQLHLRASPLIPLTSAGESDIQGHPLDGVNKPGRLRRVVLLTCANPMVASDDSDHFSQMVLQYGAAGIGMSYIGVLLGYDSRIDALLSRALGGSYRHEPQLDRVRHLFDGNLDAMLTPVAYDVALSVVAGYGVRLAGMYGGDLATDTTEFLTGRGRHVVANLTPADAGLMPRDVGRVRLSYVPEPALGWDNAVSQRFDLRSRGNADAYFEDAGIRLAVAVVNLGQQLRAACAAYYAGDAVGARAILSELRSYLTKEVDMLRDDGLAAEVALVDALLENMS